MSKRNRIVHVEWRTRDIERLKNFYKTAFRWKFEEPMTGYALADMGSKEARGGFMQIASGSPLQPGVVSFLGAEDLGAAEAAIREAGGQIVASAQPVEGWGRFSVFTDPDGNQLALWQSEEAVKQVAKDARRAAKKAEAKRQKAAKKEKKQARKAEKAAQKQALKAAKAAGTSRNSDDKKGQKKKKKKRDAGAAEASF